VGILLTVEVHLSKRFWTGCRKDIPKCPEENTFLVREY